MRRLRADAQLLARRCIEHEAEFRQPIASAEEGLREAQAALNALPGLSQSSMVALIAA